MNEDKDTTQSTKHKYALFWFDIYGIPQNK